MKSTTIIAGLSLFAFASMSYAVTVEVTGATAFRAATLLAIKAQFTASGQPFQFGHDQAAGNLSTAAPAATRAIFKGTMRNSTNTANIPNVTVRCSFNGSVEGINALVNNVSPTYYVDSTANLITAAALGGGETHVATAPVARTTEAALGNASDIAFSDVSKDSTPFAASPILGGPVGVVVFTMLGSEGTPFTNCTSQQFRALFATGFQPLSLFTGVEADNPVGASPGPNAAYVFATGRNDGSGTRTTYLAETGYGVSNKVNQYVTNISSSTALTTIQRVPYAGVATSPQTSVTGQLAANASTIWTQNVGIGNDGNGGYSSGNTLRSDMAKTGLSVNVLDENGDDAFGSPQKLTLLSWLSLNDAVTARVNGAVFLGYNGEKLDVTDGTSPNFVMTATDIAKVTEGRYTAWGFQQMYLDSTIDGGTPDEVEQKAVYDSIFTGIQGNLGTAGIAVTAMHVGRSVDGGLVNP